MGPRSGPGQAGAELEAGRVGRPHGLDGSFYVTGPRPRLLTVGTGVTVDGRTAAIVRLEGVEDRSGAEALRGMTLTVHTREAPALAEGEWWAHELEGLRVLDGERVLGTVERIVELPTCEALEVRGERAGAPLLVPMVKDAIRRVEVSEGRIEVNLDFLEAAVPPARLRPGGGAGS
jgi:16S rRNA processing protein RimM